jgi:uracil-DNA glycosylase family 4
MRTPFAASRRVVRGDGPADAKIVLVGEAPGRDETWEGRPFVGQAGQLQEREGWAPVGLCRHDVRLENVIEVRPPSNRLEALPPPQVAWWQANCHHRLAQLLSTGDGRVVVPVGNLALATLLRDPLPLTRDGSWRARRPEGIQWARKITQWRGSLLTYETDTGVSVRMVPTQHPASFLYANTGYDAWKGDWQRIKWELDYGCPPLDEGDDLIAFDGRDCARMLAEAEARGGPLAVDLETAGAQLLCVGFAIHPSRSIVLPLVDPTTRSGLKWAWYWLARFLASDVVKVFHNGLFDAFLLRWHRLPVHKWRWDTLGEHHLLDPADRHTLAYCASRDLRTTFWKEEAKETTEGPRGGRTRKIANWMQFLAYCGKDARHTIALHRRYVRRLEQAGLDAIYRAHYRRVMWAALDLSLEGMAVDPAERERLHQLARAELERLKVAITAAAGTPLTTGPKVLRSGLPSQAKHQPRGGLSGPRILQYFYETLRCREYRKGGKRTANEVALRRLGLKYKKAKPVSELLLQFRHQEKIAQFTAPERLDRDGRMRSLFRPLTKTGRCRAQRPPTGVGTNLQNQFHKVRSMFVASAPGHLLCELDLSQAEARIVDGQSGDPRALGLARLGPLELDQHRVMAADCLGKAPEDVTEEERDLIGKRGRYAYSYGMEGFRFSEVLLVETESEVVKTPEECAAILKLVERARPYIAEWQHWVKARIVNDRKLVNSWGRHLLFTQRTFGKEDFKEGLAWGPQSEVGCLLNQAGWLPLWQTIRRDGLATRLVNQGHDSVILDGPPAELWPLCQQAVQRLSTAREYPGRGGPWTLEMPVGVKLGRRWGRTMRGWKDGRIITPREFRDLARAVLAERDASAA